jgi:biotin carboxyl carrier protein
MEIKARMPSKVLSIKVVAGARVNAGNVLMVIE